MKSLKCLEQARKKEHKVLCFSQMSFTWLKTGKCSKSKENPMWFNLPTEALPLESGCCCDRWWRAWRGWALEQGCQEPCNRAASSLSLTSPVQAQVLEYPQWRFRHFPGQSVCLVGPLKHLTSRNHASPDSQLSNGNFSPHSPLLFSSLYLSLFTTPPQLRFSCLRENFPFPS